MPAETDLTLILPAYNECASIAATIEQAFAYFASRGIKAELIVSADGNDGTRELVGGMIAAHPALRVIGRVERSGKGRGIREALPLAHGRFIGYADADNKVPIEEYDIIRPELDRGCDVVIGSRALARSQVERPQPWHRRLGSKGFAVFMHAAVGLPRIHDTQCGFKFFRREAALRLFEAQRIDGYMFDVEILALAERFGYEIREVPIRWRDDADSRLQLLSGNLRNIIDIMKIRSSLAEHAPAADRVNAATAAVED
jgi:dolichyl-phosphate beta-glucosyltransferase